MSKVASFHSVQRSINLSHRPEWDLALFPSSLQARSSAFVEFDGSGQLRFLLLHLAFADSDLISSSLSSFQTSKTRIFFVSPPSVSLRLAVPLWPGTSPDQSPDLSALREQELVCLLFLNSNSLRRDRALEFSMRCQTRCHVQSPSGFVQQAGQALSFFRKGSLVPKMCFMERVAIFWTDKFGKQWNEQR